MKNILLKRKQVLLFIVAGALSAIFEIGSFKLFSVSIPKVLPQEEDWHGIYYPLSNIFSTGSGIISNYFFSIWFVFEQGKHSKKREFAYFMGVSFISTILSLFFFQVFYHYIFADHLSIGPIVLSGEMLSKISAIALVAILNYSIKKKLIFNG